MDLATLSSEQRKLLALLLDDDYAETAGAIVSKGAVDQAPLSFAQQRLWFLDQMEPGTSTYNISGPCRFRGKLNVPAMKSTLTELVRRHQALRAYFESVDGIPVQHFSEPREMELPVIDLTTLLVSERLATAQRMCEDANENEPFDLSRGPLFRASLYKLDAEDHILMIVMHHIVSDGWSLGILTSELTTLYEAFAAGRSSPLPELKFQYSDFASWQNDWLNGTHLSEQLNFWRKQLGGKLPALELATDKPRPPMQTFNGTSELVVIGQGLPDKLRELSNREGGTLFMTLMAAFQTLLWRYTGQEDVLTGTPIAGRSRAETEDLVGLFLNTLVMRVDLSGNPTFLELLGRVRSVALDAYSHQDVPFEKLVEELAPDRDLSRSPLFQVMFILQVPNRPLELPGLEMAPAALPLRQTKFELTLFLWEHADKLEGTIEYNTDLFEAATIRRMVSHYQCLLAGIVANPSARISDLPLLTPHERQRLLVEWNDTAKPVPEPCLLHEMIEAQVERTPAAIAASFEGQSLTYRELGDRSSQLAAYLRSQGVGPDVLVGICMQRSLDMLVAFLGVLKTGGAYLPIDPVYPAERVAFMLEDSGAALVLRDRCVIEARGENPKLSGQQATGTSVSPETPAYIIYTSGSTGKPKGVVIPHRAVVNFMRSMAREPGLTADDVILAVTTLSFDIAGLELFLPLTVGARIEIASREVALDATRLGPLIRESGATVMQATPATWRMLIESGWRGSPELRILCGGEALSRDLANELLECSGQLYNMYGPTETTIWSTVERIENVEGPILIGRPIDNTRIYILDCSLNPVPVGVSGELWIGGMGLARGYLHRPELTAERFLQDPFSNEPGARMYRTGDLARYRADGRIECLGRLDGQVKIRGHRIELGEIEISLRGQPGIREASVIAREDIPGDKRLVAYVVPESGRDPDFDILRASLKETLPEYMLPSAFVKLEKLPLTLSGKVDRRALPAPEMNPAARSSQFVPPGTALERTIAEVWEEVLGVSNVGRNSNFFDLGGHSLLLAKVHSRLQSRLGRELAMTQLFRLPTVRALAEHLGEQQETSVKLLAREAGRPRRIVTTRIEEGYERLKH